MPKGDNLTKKQKDFADKYIETGNATEATVQTYNVKDRNSARALGAQNLAKLNVIQYLQDKSPKAIIRLEELMDQSKHLPTALGATKDWLDRSGFKPPEKQLLAGDIKISWE